MAQKTKAKKKSIKIDSLKYPDKRKNIPTEELRDFVKEDESAPRTILYPRDPSLDPQLVWQGKDEQDSHPLEVPVVPIYIQEKIHPQAIIEDIKAESSRKQDETDFQTTMFADFNGIDFEQMVDFYQHDQNWSNRMILGDSLMVMTSLAEKEGLKGKVQTIYLDPPYGIKFGSNWQVSTRKSRITDTKIEDIVRQPEQVRAFRDTWKLGIHSYLPYLRDRLVAARELLTETGSLFIQIGEENVHLVRCILDEVFGSENFVSLIYFATTGGFPTGTLSRLGDYILWFALNQEAVKYRQLFLEKENLEKGDSFYKYIELANGVSRPLTNDERKGVIPIPNSARIYGLDNICGQGNANQKTPFKFHGKKYYPAANSHWKANYPEGMERLKYSKRIGLAGKTLRYIRFLNDKPVNPLSNAWFDTSHAGFTANKIYVVETNTKVIERCLLMTTDPGDLVLDPTCGSGTTAYVAEQWGRRWITIDTSRVSIALSRTRLMAGRYPYYLLADSREGQAKEAKITGRLPADIKPNDDIRKGFVCLRVPHIMLKAIANNEEIDIIHEKWQQKQDAARASLNKALNEKWEEWEVPYEVNEKWSEIAKEAHSEFWILKSERQKEIDDSIARHADQEILYDQPYEDKKRVRVTGPFTVESLSPHRILSTDYDVPRSEDDTETGAGGGQFETMILENLKKAGVKTTKKGEGIKFEQLEPYAGLWIQGEGEFIDAHGQTRRVAVCIGPEHGTVSPQLIKEAAKEAVKGMGFDVLVVCGFAFDPHVAEEATRYGKLNVMITMMNPDLAMGDELLKKTGSGNLFMVFGEPDLKIIDAEEGNIKVEIKGVDVYDPTTGQVRSNMTDDIACWFIDTNYNGESFFVRHAYFCGGDQPYQKLKRALRAEIDESAWESLYSTTSRPFPKPDTGKIAVKVINHYGDEVLKVYTL